MIDKTTKGTPFHHELITIKRGMNTRTVTSTHLHSNSISLSPFRSSFSYSSSLRYRSLSSLNFNWRSSPLHHRLSVFWFSSLSFFGAVFRSRNSLIRSVFSNWCVLSSFKDFEFEFWKNRSCFYSFMYLLFVAAFCLVCKNRCILHVVWKNC